MNDEDFITEIQKHFPNSSIHITHDEVMIIVPREGVCHSCDTCKYHDTGWIEASCYDCKAHSNWERKNI